MDVDDVRQFARDRAGTFETELKEFLSIPSISTLPQHAGDCRRAAQWLANHMQAAGLEHVEVIEGIGHPLVYGDWLNAPGKPTILLYGHYDVQPIDPIDLWESPPFEPAIRDGYIYARGAVDDKGQVAALLNSATSYLSTASSLPVNLRFLLEGEEESGGEHIKEFLRGKDNRLQADFTQVSDSSFFNRDTPSVETGLRGIVYAEIRVRANAHDLHSGEYGGVAPNPLISLAHIIAGLRDRDGNVTIPGFFDEVERPSEDILSSWKSLKVTAESVAAEIGAPRLIGDDTYPPIERMWARPTLDVHGIPGGFVGEGAKTVIPAEASAKVSMRLVPRQKAATIAGLFTQAVTASAPDDVDVKVRIIHADDPVVVPSDTAEVEAAKEAVRQVWNRQAVLTRSGGSIPIVGGFQEELDIPSVLLGYGLPGDNLHAPNERFLLDQFHKGIQANILFWDLVGSA